MWYVRDALHPENEQTYLVLQAANMISSQNQNMVLMFCLAPSLLFHTGWGMYLPGRCLKGFWWVSKYIYTQNNALVHSLILWSCPIQSELHLSDMISTGSVGVKGVAEEHLGGGNEGGQWKNKYCLFTFPTYMYPAGLGDWTSNPPVTNLLLSHSGHLCPK